MPCWAKAPNGVPRRARGGLFNTGHPLTIVSMPFSHLETRLAALVPRRATRIVLMDQSEDGLAERAARRLAGWGYSTSPS